MDFTRDPIIQTIVTPREGCKLVIRSSKGAGQEEFFVDAVEVVSFGGTFFFRSLERPKAFLVPASDYEILEVRETKMVLKNVGLDRSIKIASGKEKGKVKLPNAPAPTPPKELVKPVEESVNRSEQDSSAAESKKRDKKRHSRRRRGKERILEAPIEGDKGEHLGEEGGRDVTKAIVNPSMILSTLLPPPPTLISETIERYKGNALFKDVFYKEIVGEEGEKESVETAIDSNVEEEPFVSPFDEKGEEDLETEETSQEVLHKPFAEDVKEDESNSAQESGSFS